MTIAAAVIIFLIGAIALLIDNRETQNQLNKRRHK